ALDEADVAGIDAELVREDDLVHRLVALALRRRAGKEGDRAGGVEADFRRLAAWRRGGALDRVDDADAAQLAACLRLGAPRVEALDLRVMQRLVHAGFELAAIVSVDEAGLERHRARRNEVAAAQRDSVDSELARGAVDDALNDVAGFGPAGAAVRRGRTRVGE